MAFGKDDHGITGDVHRLELFELVGGFRIVEIIKGFDFSCNLPLVIEHPLAIDLPIQSCMTRSALLHELGKEARLVSGPPFIRDMAKNSLTDCLALPIGDHLTGIDFNVFIADEVTLLIAGIEDVKVFNAMASQFREGRHRLGLRAALGND